MNPASEPIRFTAADVRTYYAARLPNLRLNSGKDWRCACPIHGGKNQESFSVVPETGAWYCHSACNRGGDILDLEQVLSGYDFRQAKQAVFDLIGRVQDLKQKQKRRQVEAYDYVDEGGKLLFQCVRFEPKGFSQRQPADGGEWAWNLKDVRLVPYRLPQVIAADLVFIVEGERDVATIEDLGFTATCNPMGAGKWRPEFAPFFRGKRVVIIPDNDEPGRKHAQAVYDTLRATAEAIRFIILPAPHKDVTEWHAATGGGIDELRELTAESLPAIAVPEPDPPQSTAILEHEFAPQVKEGKKLAPNDLALEILREHQFLRAKGGYLYTYNARCWELIDRERIESIAMQHDCHRWTTVKRRSEAAKYIIHRCNRTAIRWRQLEPYEVPAFNGVVDIRTGQLRPHRAEDYLETTAAQPYEPEAECDRWLKALMQYFYQDPDYRTKHDALQEFFGYLLMPHARYKKALLACGESDTGKSILGFVARLILGDENICSLSVEDMDDPRKLAPIMGKMANILTELTNDAVIADGGFKKLVSTEEGVQVDEKYLPSITYTPIAKHLIITNPPLPRINDKSRAMYNRLLLIMFNRVLPQSEQDRKIWDLLRVEGPGIFAWAILGAKRLFENNGEFTKIPESQVAIENYRLGENPVNEFIEEKCIRDEDEKGIQSTEFWSKYSAWCSRSIDRRAMAAALDSAGFKIKQVRIDSQTVKRVVPGLRWRD